MSYMNQLVYGIIGATLADRKSDTDAPLSQNAKMRSAVLSSLGGSAGAMGSLLVAKVMADETVKSETAVRDNLALAGQIQQLAGLVANYQLAVANFFVTDPASGQIVVDPNVGSKVSAAFNSDGTLK